MREGRSSDQIRALTTNHPTDDLQKRFHSSPRIARRIKLKVLDPSMFAVNVSLIVCCRSLKALHFTLLRVSSVASNVSTIKMQTIVLNVPKRCESRYILTRRGSDAKASLKLRPR